MRVTSKANLDNQEFCAYPGPSHYFSTSAHNAMANWRPVARQIFRDSLDCLHMV